MLISEILLLWKRIISHDGCVMLCLQRALLLVLMRECISPFHSSSVLFFFSVIFPSSRAMECEEHRGQRDERGRCRTQCGWLERKSSQRRREKEGQRRVGEVSTACVGVQRSWRQEYKGISSSFRACHLFIIEIPPSFPPSLPPCLFY